MSSVTVFVKVDEGLFAQSPNPSDGHKTEAVFFSPPQIASFCRDNDIRRDVLGIRKLIYIWSLTLTLFVPGSTTT